MYIYILYVAFHVVFCVVPHFGRLCMGSPLCESVYGLTVHHPQTSLSLYGRHSEVKMIVLIVLATENFRKSQFALNVQ